MTKEQEHILEYLKTLLPTIWDNLSDYAKTNSITNKPYKSVKDLLRDIKEDVDFMEWYFFEVLSYHTDKDILESLIEYSCEDYHVYKVNNKFLKRDYEGVTTYTYSFIDEKDISTEHSIKHLEEIIEQLRAENKELKQIISNFNNNE